MLTDLLRDGEIGAFDDDTNDANDADKATATMVAAVKQVAGMNVADG
jgi:hypothetical protein